MVFVRGFTLEYNFPHLNLPGQKRQLDLKQEIRFFIPFLLLASFLCFVCLVGFVLTLGESLNT